MMKIFKKIILSTILITPLIISVGALSSCSSKKNYISIIDSSYDSIALFEPNQEQINNYGLEKGYYFDTTIVDKSTVVNEVFKKALKRVPKTPKFVDVATPIVNTFDLGLVENTKPTIRPGNLPPELVSSETENQINYSEFNVKKQSLDSKSTEIENIIKDFQFSNGLTDGTKVTYPSTAFDFKTNANNVLFDATFIVKEKWTLDNTTTIINRSIEFSLLLKFELKNLADSWATLKTNDPIFFFINWNDSPKATLFEDGFFKPNVVVSTKKTIDFYGTLRKDVFEDKRSEINTIWKMKEWLEGKDTFTTSTITDITSSQLTAASNNLYNKLPKIFQYLKGSLENYAPSSPSNFGAVIEPFELLNQFIKKPSINNKATPSPKLGSPSIIVSVVRINEMTPTYPGSFMLELEFKLDNNNNIGWYGLDGENAKLPIKFILFMNNFS